MALFDHEVKDYYYKSFLCLLSKWLLILTILSFMLYSLWQLDLTVMHQSLVNTAPPPTGKGGDYDFSVSVPCYEPHPQGGKLEVKALLFAPPFTIEYLPGVRILCQNPVISPALRGHLSSAVARLSPTLPRRWWAVVTNDWYIILVIMSFSYSTFFNF